MNTHAPVPPSADADRNHLLRFGGEALDPSPPGFEPVALEAGQTLVEAGDFTTAVYFPTRGVISLLSSTDRGDSVEVAAVGREGVAAPTAMLGPGPSPYRLLVQVPGTALRADSGALLDHVNRKSAFRERLFRYLHVLVGQITQSAACNRYHRGQHRLARWLLTVSDRAATDVLPVTQEFAAIMVGDQRPRVTSALRRLRDRGLVRQRRGEITILDREGLSRASCECYRIVQRYFDALLDGSSGGTLRDGRVRPG